MGPLTMLDEGVEPVLDLIRSYDLDGLQWGAERMGPLMNVIVP